MPQLSFVGVAAAAALFLATLVGSPAMAAESRGPRAGEDGLTVRVGGPLHVREGERLTSVMVIDGQAVVEGHVDDALFVANGDAYVTGHVGGDATVVNGTLRLGPKAFVQRVSLVQADLDAAPGAVVGSVERSGGFQWSWSNAFFAFAMWVGFTLLVVVAGWLYTATAPHLVTRARDTMLHTPGESVIGALVVAIALPLSSVPLFATGIGIPLGLSILVVVVPALLFFGFLTSGIALGVALTSRVRRADGVRLGIAATLGLLVLQLLAAIPFLGFLVALVASLWGAGALAVLAFRAIGRRQRGERGERA